MILSTINADVITLFIVGIILIIKCGDCFVDSASWIAEKSGLPKLIVGATIVSIGTTLPELITSVIATSQGEIGLSIGNAIGSVTANTGLILSISIIAIPAIVSRKEYGFKSVLLLVVTSALLIFLLDTKLNIVEAIICLLMLVAFVIENVYMAKKAIKMQEIIQEEVTEVVKEKVSKKEVTRNIIMFIIGAAGIYYGSKLLVDKGKIIAGYLNISEAIIGLTLVAIGTSLPELVTTITAIIKKQSSLSVGNIIGANIIDMAMILPVCSFISNGALEIESNQTIYLDIPVCLTLIAIMIIPMLITKKFSRWQGITALTLYIAYLVVMCTGIISF